MIVKLEIQDDKGCVREESQTMFIDEKSNETITLIIGEREYYFLSDGQMFLNKQPFDVFVVMYNNPEAIDGPALTYTLRARNDRDAMRQALLHTEFLSYLNMRNFDKKFLSAHKPKIYSKEELGKVVKLNF